MKKIATIILLICAFNTVGNSETFNPLLISNTIQSVDDGWYEATVVYFNPSTYTRSKYSLNVRVRYNTVVEIDFGNGGSVHSGINNEGYLYTGGSLYLQKDYNGNIIGATAKVMVTQGGSMKTFDISL